MESQKENLNELNQTEIKIKKYIERLKELKEKLKQNKKNEEILKTMESIDDNKIYLNFFFFKNLKKLIHLDKVNNNNTKQIFKYLCQSNEINNNKDIYGIIIHWIYFLYMELINNIYYTESVLKSKEINQINFLLELTFDIIIKLYTTQNILFSTKNIFQILYFFLFLIENNFFINYNLNNFDKFYKIKNYILLKNLFTFFGNISYIILNKANINEKKEEDIEFIDENYKKEISLFFEFLKDLEENKEINFRINKSIILNNDLLANLFEKIILDKINIEIMDKYEINFKNQLINFYANFAKFNFNESKILPNILESLKYSFMNLNNFNENKELINKDMFIQGFYVKLLKKLLFYEDKSFNCNENKKCPLFNSFFFNSYDSGIELNIKSINKFLDNFSLFFSINLSPKEKNEQLYPIFLIGKNGKEVLLNLSLKYKEKENEYEFLLSLNNQKVEIKENKILIGMTYYINIYFIHNKMIFSYFNGKSINFAELKINKSSLESDNNYNLIFGKNEAKSFSGYIGPIIIIKNLSNSKEEEIRNFIKYIFRLNIYYQYFIFLKKDSNYYFKNSNLFNINNILNRVKEKLEKLNFECLLYLNPTIFLSKKIKSGINQKTYLPNIDDICPVQKNYEIRRMNITLVRQGNTNMNFINENGLNYICLLYEYIYQFLIRLEDNKITNSKETQKILVSIVRKTLFIIWKNFIDLKISNLNKILKQLFMNIFYCLKLISKNYYIMDDALDSLFNISIIYKNSIMDITDKKLKKQLKISDYIIDNILQINYSFLNGLIDFLLTPELYDFTNSKTLIKLFDNLTSYFEFGNLKEASTLINLHFYVKLLSFAPKLIDYFEKEEDEEGKSKIININTNKKHEIANNYFLILKKFFENNASKTGNFINLKYIFNYIEDNFDTNYEVCLVYFKFIYELIGNNPDLYFSDDINIEQIKMLFLFIYRFSENDEKEIKLNKEIILNNRRKILNQIISIIMKILFTKKRINNNPFIINEFTNLLKNTEISSDLINTITKEIGNLINNSIGAKTNKIEKNMILSKKEDNIENNLENYSSFYSEIFKLILFFLEYPFNNSNISNIKDLDIYEDKVFETLQIIGESVKGNIQNKNLTQDTVYCLIYLLKFYNDILFRRLYPEKYIQEFIKVCQLCKESYLIYSNFLIKLSDDCYKTISEIILDICLNYIILSSKHFDEPLSFEQINGVRNDDIKKEHEMIYKYLKELFQEKDKKKVINTIFYQSDNLNFLAKKAEKEKKKSRKDSSIEMNKEFQKYKIIYSFLLKEKNKFYLNFSTFFLIKLYSYNKLLININVKFLERNSEMKDILKYREILKLITETIQKIYKEHELLYRNKDYVKQKKKHSSESEYYEEVKKRIIIGMKSSNYEKVEKYINKNILENDEIISDFFNCINSGKFSKFDNKSFSIKNKEKESEIINSINPDIKEFNLEDKQDYIKTPKIKNSVEENSKSFDEDSSLTSTEKDVTPFHFDEESSSGGTLDKKNEINLTPQSSKTVRTAIRRKTVNNEDKEIYNITPFNSQRSYTNKDKNIRKFSENNHLISKKFDKNSSSDEEKDDEDIPYINFFEKPDIWLLKNSKKELMMNVFSVYFSDYFFDNKIFKLMKKYYLQKTEGINVSTKLLDFPSKLKNYSNGLEPFLFLKPFPQIFIDKLFFVSHEYFYNYLKQNKDKIKIDQIILYKKIFQKFNLEDKFEQKCELIKINKNYYGRIIASELYNFFIFEELKYEFYEEENIKNDKQDLNDLFTLSVVSKQPKLKSQIKRIKEVESSMLFEPKKKEKKILIIIFEEIEEILAKRFLLMWQAIEIYLKNGKSYFFNLINQENCKKILEFFKNNPLTKDKIREKDYIKKEKLLRTEWVEERFTTYEYLLFINKYGSRTFNDTNQYPIFPWLIKIDDNCKIDKRDLKYPMAAQIEKNREFSIRRYLDEENSKKPNHFGTHYSTAAYIYFYLMRVEPYTSLLIKLQGYRQEVAERMFCNFYELLYIFNNGRDNRELIPEIYNNIEIFLNLNCADFGIKKNDERVDDFLLGERIGDEDSIIRNENNSNVSDYVQFVTDNKKSLNSKKVSMEINNWIDIIFGVQQLPESEKNRKKSLNIFYHESYEQNLNMFEKMEKLIKKGKEKSAIINKILSKINLIISFGQTPHQVFDDNHPKYCEKTKNMGNDFESELSDLIWGKELKLKIDLSPLFFVVNSYNGKIFIMDKSRRLEIIDNTLYFQKEDEKFQLIRYGKLQLPYIKLNRKIKIKKEGQDSQLYYYIIKEKYCISSFEDKIDFDSFVHSVSFKDLKENEKEKEKEFLYNDNNNDFNLYYNFYIKKLKYEIMKKDQKKKKKKEEEIIKFITCRHLDNSFKVYFISKSNFKKEYKPMSFICEDFVSSCCTISYNKFIVGLKNGKLLKFSIEKDQEELSRTKKENINIKIKLNMEIRAHRGEINMIEIDKRLGVIITAGTDNILYIRKLYDLELLIPIKFKKKFLITSAKISPLNLLYVLCFNKNKGKSYIRGYTLNGVFFAKSYYAFFDTIDFTRNGSIITFVNKSRLKILNSYNLKEKHKFKTADQKILNEFNSKIVKLHGSSWMKFDFFSKKNYVETNTKFITYTNLDGKINTIKTLDLSDFSYFD